MSVVILDGVRTPFGKFLGSLASYSTIDLGVTVVDELVRRVPDIKEADGVFFGIVIQANLGQNPARQIAHRAGIALKVPALTLNNVCLAGISATVEAARRILLHEGELYIVGGADSMTNAPHATTARQEKKLGSITFSDTLNDGLWCAIHDQSMGVVSDEQNECYNIPRAEQDAFAARSQQLAERATQEGFLQGEIVTLKGNDGILDRDEGIRPGTREEKLATLPPAFTENGTITAGNASQLSDGASGGIVTTEERAYRLGVEPLARIVDWAEIAGPDSGLHDKPAQAIQAVLSKQNLRVSDIDLFEINEAFAGVVLASMARLDIPIDRVNVNGGAIAVGHPLGGTGFRLVLTLARELKRRGGGRGIATLCGGGGQGAALLIEVPPRW